MLPDDLHHISERQTCLALDRPKFKLEWRHLREDAMLLGAPAHPPGLAHHVAVARTRASVLAHGKRACIARRFIRAVLAATGVIRDDGREHALGDIAVRDEPSIKLLEIEEGIVACDPIQYEMRLRLAVPTCLRAARECHAERVRVEPEARRLRHGRLVSRRLREHMVPWEARMPNSPQLLGVRDRPLC